MRTVDRMTSLMRTRPVLGLVAAASSPLSPSAGGERLRRRSSEKDASASASPSASADPEAGRRGPDLAGIPEVVAEVNGEEVTKDEFFPLFESAFQQATAAGPDHRSGARRGA